MSESNYTIAEQGSFDIGMEHGYKGSAPEHHDHAYIAGYKAGSQQWDDEVASQQEADYWSDAAYEYDAVSQGYYDDDPSPYNGDYSEM